MIFHALVIDFIQFVNLHHIDIKYLEVSWLGLSVLIDIHCVKELWNKEH